MVRGNWTSAPSAPSLGGGPVHYGTGLARVISGSAMMYDEDKKAKMTRIVSPYLSFETERSPMRTFRGMLKVLDERGFSYVVDFDGPKLGIVRARDEDIRVAEVLEALADDDDDDVPAFLGIRAQLAHRHDREDIAKLKVKAGSVTKVKLKVKGTITKHTWNQLRSRIRRKFHVKV